MRDTLAPTGCEAMPDTATRYEVSGPEPLAVEEGPCGVRPIAGGTVAGEEDDTISELPRR